jgi:L-cysteine desulfidase
MTSVDAAYRAASLAMSGIGIPATDGIVGEDGAQSLAHLGRIAGPGMGAMDAQILEIMQANLRHGNS